MPGGGLIDGLCQDKAGQGLYQIGPLSELDELVGRNHRLSGWLPTNQRLDADDPSRDQINLGLIVKQELPGLNAVAQPASQNQALGAVVITLSHVESHPAVI